MDGLKSELEKAAEHVAQARLIVARQAARAKALRGMGYAAAAIMAENTLGVFIATLKALEDHKRLLREEIDQRAEWRR